MNEGDLIKPMAEAGARMRFDSSIPASALCTISGTLATLAISPPGTVA